MRVLVRIFKHLKTRFDTLTGLSPWLIDLLSFNSATVPANTHDPLAINVAFRRALQLLSSGIFLPGSVGFIDPCESGQVNVRRFDIFRFDPCIVLVCGLVSKRGRTGQQRDVRPWRP